MTEPQRHPRIVSPRSTWGLVAVACAVALGVSGALAAEGTGHRAVYGAGLGALAALLAVLALPSVPTRTAASLIVVLGGVVVARHARQPGTSLALVVAWAVATLVALVLIDRADLDERPRLAAGPAPPGVGVETARAVGGLGLAVLLVAALLVPVFGHRPTPPIGEGRLPHLDVLGGSTSVLSGSDHLDTTVRPHLGNEVVFTVTASRPEFWRGETFDVWDGSTWSRSDDHVEALASAADGATVVPPPGSVPGSGDTLTQTFHIEAPFSEVVFAAAEPIEVSSTRIPVERSADGTLLMDQPLGQGSSYRVVSQVPDATTATLRAADPAAVPAVITSTYAQPPETTARVKALAASVTAGAPTVYDKVRALEAWMGAHTEYSLNAPTARLGVDVVDDFLFNVRKGWCEQISSSLVVMLRSLGIPAREATGFVPGDRSQLTGEWVVRAKHAHAWAEVYFAGVGWQAFDPTANVPLAGDARAPQSPWSWMGHHLLLAFGLVFGGVLLLAAGAALLGAARRRHARTRSWAARRFDELERLGARAGRPRRPSETAPDYAAALGEVLAEPELARVGATIDADAFSPEGAGAGERARAEAVLAAAGSRRLIAPVRSLG